MSKPDEIADPNQWLRYALKLHAKMRGGGHTSTLVLFSTISPRASLDKIAIWRIDFISISVGEGPYNGFSV